MDRQRNWLTHPSHRHEYRSQSLASLRSKAQTGRRHPRFKSHQRVAKNLVKRAGNALKAERKFPEKLYKGLYRPTEVSLQFIHWLRVSLTRPTCYRQAIKQLRPLCRLTSRILDDRVHYWEITALSALFGGW